MKHVKLVHSVDDSGATADTRPQFNSDDAVLNQLLTEYDGLFEGIGEFPGEHSFTLHPAAKPAVHPPRTPTTYTHHVGYQRHSVIKSNKNCIIEMVA